MGVTEGENQSGSRTGFSLSLSGFLHVWCKKWRVYWEEIERGQELRMRTSSDLPGSGRLGDFWKGKTREGDGKESA